MSSAYRFLPWVRRGLAASITGLDTGNGVPARARLAVELALSDGTSVDGRVELHGPGDVTGLDPRIILRSDPRPGSVAVEPNYLAAIEFDPPDLPWLFTPAAAGPQDRLRPWCVLVVVHDRDGITIEYGGGALLPVLAIAEPADARAELPDLVESWAWAHAQVVYDDISPLDVATDLLNRPVANLSRLICPRRLEADTAYLACVVPAFAHGVQSGLGLPVEGAQTAPAWDVAIDSHVRLPVYHHWRFSTGPNGDIESLAAALTAVPAPKGLGTVAVFLGSADPELADLDPHATGSVIAVRGALVAPAPAVPDPSAPPLEREQDPRVGQVLRARVDDARRTGTLGPPLYGEWHLDVHAVPDAGWVAEANSEAEHRIAAGVGAAVVRSQQEQLVQAALDQVGELTSANQLFNRAVLSGHAADSVVERHLAGLPAGRAAQLTRSWQERVASPDSGADRLSVDGTVAVSSLPRALLSGAYRRLSAARRPAARRAAQTGLTRQRTLLDFDAADVLALDSSAPVPAALDALEAATTIPLPAGGGDNTRVSLHSLGLPGTTTLGRVRQLQQAARTGAVSAIALGGGVGAGRLNVRDEFDDDIGGPMTPDTSGAAQRFQQALAVVQARVNNPAPELRFVPAGLDRLQQRVMQRAAPATAIPRRVGDRLVGSAEADDPPPMSGLQRIGDGDVPSSVIAYPQIVSPVATMVDALPGSWLLPGVEGVAQNTVTLLETNPAFVASCLLGANQELNAELLWRQFPTDRRGTSLRRFWVRRNGSTDIEPINRWDPGASLDDLAVSTGEGQLVLVLRGQLLLRYPDIVVYAVAGDLDGPHDDDPSAIVLPVFSGRTGQDVAYVGFPISRADAETAQTWFILQQQAAAPRFGFDVSRDPATTAVSWAAVTWDDLTVPPGAHLSAISGPVTGLDLLIGGVGAGSVTRHGFGPSSAEVAAATLQRPIRVAIHVSRLLSTPA
jgi:hypothetical protein